MKLRNTFLAVSAAAALAACAFMPPAYVQPSQTFSQTLSNEYSAQAGASYAYAKDGTTAQQFRDRAHLAANGVDVQPQDPETWNVPREYRPELNNAYDMLQIALVPDAKKITSPVNAAQAQANFDCWVEQAHRNWTPTNPKSQCRMNFYRAICRMYNKQCGSKVVETMIAKDRIYRVYFRTDSTAINHDGSSTIDKAVAEYRQHGTEVIVAGHADRVGKQAYNLNLSKRRAAAVKAELIRRGVPASKINGKYFGEQAPLVPTQDEVANGNNRRVLIVVR